jgi:hypothetical protein
MKDIKTVLFQYVGAGLLSLFIFTSMHAMTGNSESAFAVFCYEKGCLHYVDNMLLLLKDVKPLYLKTLVSLCKGETVEDDAFINAKRVLIACNFMHDDGTINQNLKYYILGVTTREPYNWLIAYDPHHDDTMLELLAIGSSIVAKKYITCIYHMLVGLKKYEPDDFKAFAAAFYVSDGESAALEIFMNKMQIYRSNFMQLMNVHEENSRYVISDTFRCCIKNLVYRDQNDPTGFAIASVADLLKKRHAWHYQETKSYAYGEVQGFHRYSERIH